MLILSIYELNIFQYLEYKDKYYLITFGFTIIPVVVVVVVVVEIVVDVIIMFRSILIYFVTKPETNYHC